MGQGKVSPFPRVWSPGVLDTVSLDFLLSSKVVSFLTLIVFPSVHTIFSLIQTDSSVRSSAASAYDGGTFSVHCLDQRQAPFLLHFLPATLEVQVLHWRSLCVFPTCYWRDHSFRIPAPGWRVAGCSMWVMSVFSVLFWGFLYHMPGHSISTTVSLGWVQRWGSGKLPILFFFRSVLLFNSLMFSCKF